MTFSAKTEALMADNLARSIVESARSRIEQFRSSPPGTTGRAFLSARRPVGNLMKRRSRRLG